MQLWIREVWIMKAAKKWLTAILIGLLVFSVSTEVLAYQVLKTTTDLRLREGPSATTAILDVIPTQTPVEIFSTTGNWAKTEYLDQSGYAGLKYFAPIAATTLKKVTVNLRLRSSPSLSGLILAVIPSHTPIPTFGRSEDWIKTVWSGKVGWVSTTYVRALEALPQMQTTVNLRLRAGPSTSYPILMMVPARCVIPVLITSNGWAKTWTGGKTGWMSMTYLNPFSLEALRPTAPPVSLLTYSNEKMEWSHTYPQDYCYGFPELDSHYRYDDGKVHLTIDCVYELGLTAQYLDVLKAENVKARFYTTGPYMRDNPDLVRRMLNEGHQVGNHTWTHPDSVDLMAESMQLVMMISGAGRISSNSPWAAIPIAGTIARPRGSFPSGPWA